MDYFKSDNQNGIYILRLDPGDYVLESINSMTEREKIDYAVVLSGIGTLDKYVMHMVTTVGYPPVEFLDKKDNRPYELVCINGLIVNKKPHLHMVISDDKMAYGGHLEDGCRVLYIAEIVIQAFDGFKIKRINNQNGIMELIK